MLLANKLPIKYLYISASKDMLLVAIFTLIMTIAHYYVEFPSIPIAISVLLGTAISLILSFRLAQSYDRWWEARMIWGAIVNDSRSLVLQLLNFTQISDRQNVEKMAKRHIVWVDAVALMLRKQQLDTTMKKYVTDDEHQLYKEATHAPLLIMQDQMQSLRALELNSYEKMQIDSTIVRLVSSMGQAERIKNTVFPSEYQRYLHFSIYLFLGFTSISLANLGHQWEILLLILIASPFFLLERAAKHLQDPFENRPTDVPVSSIARNIEINILTLLQDDEIPKPLEPEGFFIN
jgi:putative membrane protein